jgi:hypothetical protein
MTAFEAMRLSARIARVVDAESPKAPLPFTCNLAAGVAVPTPTLPDESINILNKLAVPNCIG